MPSDAETEKLRRILSLAFNSDIDYDAKAPNAEFEMANKEIYLLRAFYATIFLTHPENHVFLVRHNSCFIENLFSQIYTVLRPSVIYQHSKSDKTDEGKIWQTINKIFSPRKRLLDSPLPSSDPHMPVLSLNSAILGYLSPYAF